MSTVTLPPKLSLLEAISPTARTLLTPATNVALSIRQPWAWLILNAGKDVENRDWSTIYRGPVLIHASKTMTKADYESCQLFLSAIAGEICFDPGLAFPTFEELRAQTGGIVGQVDITDCVNESKSPWFCGEFGFVLANPKPLPLTPYKGMLKFFNVQLKEAK